mgnify:CR=1 FL=1
MQDFTTFDIVIIAITVLLGLKGLFKGFIKEVFGLIGIVGGIFVASRLSDTVGELIKPILGLENSATISLLGFIAALIAFWLVIYVIGMILSKVTSMSGLGVVDRTLGFAFGAAKIFLIFSVIAYALYQVDSFKTTLDKQFSKSVVFPFLVKTGSYIMKLDTSKFVNTVDKTVDAVVPSQNEETKKESKPTTQIIKEKVEETTAKVEETTKSIINEEIKKELDEKVTQIREQIETPTDETKIIKEELNTTTEEVTKGN